MNRTVLLAISLLGLTTTLSAQQGRRGGGPPPEALAACENQEAGSLCEFSTPRGTVEGSCAAPSGRPLACVPNDHERPPSE